MLPTMFPVISKRSKKAPNLSKFLTRLIDPDEILLVEQLIALTIGAMFHRRLAIVIVVLATLIAVLNPAGIGGIDFSDRLQLCMVVALMISAYAVILGSYVVVILSRYDVAPAYASQISTALACLYQTPIFVSLFPESNFLIYGFWANFACIFLIMATISCGVTFIFNQVLDAEVEDLISNAREVDCEVESSAANTSLQNLLPSDVQGTVLSLLVEDNYVRVTTDKGSYLLLLSLSTAAATLDKSQGLRVHRSLWLNWSEMDRLFYENGNPRIQTRDGAVWPVSRTKVDAIKLALQKKSIEVSSEYQ